MSLLDTLTQAADEEQLRLQPLPKHALAGEAEHTRRHYALLLAATLGAQDTIAEAQTRLFRLLLDALALGDIRAALFDEARALAPETLLEAARLIRSSGYASHLLLDALVLLRIEAPLGDEMARLMAELAAFLGLDEAELRRRARDAAAILGLPAINEEEALPEEVLRLLAECWPARLCRPLTQETLRHGLQGGLWWIEDSLEVDFSWQAAGAWIFFQPGAKLITNPKGGATTLADCRVIQASMSFVGKGEVALERCQWEGRYDPDPELKSTALELLNVGLSAQDCAFSTPGARAIRSQEASLTLVGCRFNACGHPALAGGAVAHLVNGRSPRTIENCRFDRCAGARGGALFTDQLYGVCRCEFVACLATDLNEPIAIFSEAGLGDPAVKDCVFRQCSLVLGASYWGMRVIFVKDCQFENGNIYYHNKYSSNSIAENCRFKGGAIIQHRF